MNFRNIKQVLGLLTMTAAMSAGTSYASDNISVTVNGLTYQCGAGTPEPQFRTYCKCINTSAVQWHWILELHSVNIATGEDRAIAHLEDHGTRDDSPESCRRAISQNPTCR